MIGYWPVVIVLKVFLQGHGVMWNVQHRVQVVREDLKKKMPQTIMSRCKSEWVLKTLRRHTLANALHQHVRTAFCYFTGFLSPVRPKLGM